MKYGKALKVIRALADLEQRDLARLGGVDPSHISMIERGVRSPSVETLTKISKGLGIPYHLLTFLGAEPDDVKNASAAQLQTLGEALAGMLFEHASAHAKRKSASRAARRRSAKTRSRLDS
jgi:transcriptional regulator with XRE-family HTH domain